MVREIRCHQNLSSFSLGWTCSALRAAACEARGSVRVIRYAQHLRQSRVTRSKAKSMWHSKFCVDSSNPDLSRWPCTRVHHELTPLTDVLFHVGKRSWTTAISVNLDHGRRRQWAANAAHHRVDDQIVLWSKPTQAGHLLRLLQRPDWKTASPFN